MSTSNAVGSTKRIEWVDIGKYICIMFVMLTHLESSTDFLSSFYSPFFLTTFFFLAGYVYRQPDSFKTHMYKKFRGLFVPWLIFSNLNILLSAVISLKGERNTGSELFWNALQIRGQGDGIWFVAALFVAFIPFYFFIKWNQPVKAVVLSIILSVASMLYSNLMNPELLPWGTAALPWHIEYMFQAMLWMVLGYYFRHFGEKVYDRYLNKITLAINWVVYLIAAYAPMGGGIWSIPVSYLRSVLGIAAIIGLCKQLKTNKYIAFVGANTITYFSLHGKLYAVIEAVLGKFGFYNAWLESVAMSSLTAIVITVVMSFILIIPAWIIDRWFPWVLGRKRKPKKS